MRIATRVWVAAMAIAAFDSSANAAELSGALRASDGAGGQLGAGAGLVRARSGAGYRRRGRA